MKRIVIMMIGIVMTSGCAAAKEYAGGLNGALDVSTSGVYANQVKLNAIAKNIANIDTTKTPQGIPYRKKIVTFKTNGRAKNIITAGDTFNAGNADSVIAEISEDTSAFQKIYYPSHPESDKNGFVYLPNVDLTSELVDMARTKGAYESNVIVFNNTKQMMQTSLEIGK